MAGKKVLENEHAVQGVYQPESCEDANAMFNEASAMVVPLIQKIADILAEDWKAHAKTEREKVVRHYAHVIAAGALSDVNVGFQSAQVQEALNDLKAQHAALLRSYLFEHGVRDADVLTEKLAKEKKEVRS